MKRRLSAIAAVVAFAALPAAATVSPAVVAAKSCSAGYTHAVMPDGSHKCLRAGQFCSRKASAQRVYRKKGFYCPPSKHLRRN
jgi:hypothetical protein